MAETQQGAEGEAEGGVYRRGEDGEGNGGQTDLTQLAETPGGDESHVQKKKGEEPGKECLDERHE